MKAGKGNYWTAAAALSLAALALAGCSGSAGSSSGSAGSSSNDGDSLATASTSVGKVIVDGQGKTVYFFAKDTKGEMASQCTGACASFWPPVQTSGTPKVTGITGTVGTIASSNGKQQVTVDGLPIYTYAGDGAKGDIKGQDINQDGGLWWVVAPSGTKITTKP